MIEWFLAQVRDRLELAFFVTITLGYAIGRIRIGSFALGAVTGVLLAGVLVGQLGISLPAAVKQIFFLLFLFSIGYRTGPQFFRGLKKDGLAQAGVAAIFGCLALGLTYGAARILGYDAGTAVGLLAGAFTESATIGTGTDAISHLTVDEAVRTALANKIPVAFAVTYLVGVIAATWFLSQIGPRRPNAGRTKQPWLAVRVLRISSTRGGISTSGRLRSGPTRRPLATRWRTSRACLPTYAFTSTGSTAEK